MEDLTPPLIGTPGFNFLTYMNPPLTFYRSKKLLYKYTGLEPVTSQFNSSTLPTELILKVTRLFSLLTGNSRNCGAEGSRTPVLLLLTIFSTSLVFIFLLIQNRMLWITSIHSYMHLLPWTYSKRFSKLLGCVSQFCFRNRRSE